MYKIYLIKLNGCPVYVGKTIATLKHRWGQHKTSPCRNMFRLIQKHGEDKFSHCVIDTADDYVDGCNKEDFWTLWYLKQGYTLQNKQVGRHRTEQIADKIRRSKMGHSVSVECRRKISETLTGKYNGARSRSVYCNETGITYPSASEAGRQLKIDGVGVARVARGERSSLHGYHFSYAG